MNLISRFFVISSVLMLLGGCQTMMSGFEAPKVAITSIQMLPATGLEQNFEVGLRLTNPNSRTLALKGMSYSVIIDGYQMASGVTSNIPSIAPYETASMIIPISTSLINSLRLVQSLMKNNKQEISYQLQARLDTGIAFMPKLTVLEEGKIGLNNLGSE